jgi:hypothetical protein
MPHHSPWYAPESEVTREWMRERLAEAREEKAEFEALAWGLHLPEPTAPARGTLSFTFDCSAEVSCEVYQLGRTVTLLYRGEATSEDRFDLDDEILVRRLGQRHQNLVRPATS